MMKRLFSGLLLAALLLAFAPAEAAREEKPAYTAVLQGTLNLRKTASPAGAVLDRVKEGKTVQVLSNDGMWCKVKAGSRTGYLMASHLKMSGNYTHLGWGRTADDGTVLNVYQAADASSAVVYKAASGGVFELISLSGGWYRVRAGEAFGYLPEKAVTRVQGDFGLGYSVQDSQNGVTADRLRYAPREIGDEVSEEGSVGDLTYRFVYPALHLPEADAKIAQWLGKIKKTYRQDLDAHHPGASGTLTVEYTAVKVSNQYQSVMLIGEYRTGGWTVQSFLPLNIDAQAGEVIPTQKIFRKNRAWVLFCLESGIADWLLTPTDGYTCKPEAEWLKYAVMGRDGMEVYLPAGRWLPPSLGTRTVTLTYRQMDGCLGLNEQFMAQYRRTIDPAKPMIALTFDDGPSPETDKIVRVLTQYNARATFCVVGNRVEGYADVLKRTVAAGNEIASHTWNHTKLTERSLASIRSQLTRSMQAVKETAGYDVKALRPPYGSVNKNVRSACKENGLFVITWNIDTLDWQTRSTSKTYRAIVRNTKSGNVILMHDLYATTAAAVEKAVPELVEKGIQLVTVSELLSFHKNGITPGTVYSSLDAKNMKTN